MMTIEEQQRIFAKRELDKAAANARLIADAPQLAADNEALRKENAELKAKLETVQPLLSRDQYDAIRADRDRLQEQVRVLEEQSRAVATVINSDTAAMSALQGQVRVLRTALERIHAEVEGHVDGAPDVGPASKLANMVTCIAEGVRAAKEL